MNTSLEESPSIGLDENSGLLTQWKFSLASKKVDYYNYNGKGSWALGHWQGYHCISTHCVLGQWWTESSTASSFLSWGVSMMFDTWSRRLLAGQSRPPCDKCMGQATVPLLVHQMCLENHDEQIRRRYLINPGVCFLAPQKSLQSKASDPFHPIPFPSHPIRPIQLKQHKASGVRITKAL